MRGSRGVVSRKPKDRQTAGQEAIVREMEMVRVRENDGGRDSQVS